MTSQANQPESDNLVELHQLRQRIVELEAALQKLGFDSSYTLSSLAWSKAAPQKKTSHYKILLDNASDLIVSMSEDGCLIYVNRAWQELLGYKPAEILGHGIFEFIAPECQQNCTDVLKKLLDGEEMPRVQVTFHSKHGDLFDVEGAVNLQQTVDGSNVINGIFRDISEYKRIEQALRKSEERYRNIFETVGVALWEEDFSTVKASIDELKEKGLGDFRRFLDEHPEYLIQMSQSIKIKDINQMTLRQYGASSKEELLGALYKVFIPETLNIFREEVLAIAERKSYFEGETRNRTLQGDYLDIILTMTIPKREEEFASVLVSTLDISERKAVEKEMLLERARFRQLFENAPIPIALVDTHDRVQDINQAFVDLFGYQQSETYGCQLNDLIVPPQFIEEASSLSSKASNGQSVLKQSTRQTKDKTLIPVQIYGAPIFFSGKVVGAYAMYADLTDRIQKESKLEYISSHDALTGLYNRAFFEAEMNRLDDEDVAPVSILIGDVDGLKTVNDRLGHSAGDDLLRNAASAIKSSFRSEDIVARIGGDEFAVLLPRTSANRAQQAVERIQDCIAEYNAAHPSTSFRVSFGSATGEGRDSLPFVLREADRLMYLDKAKSKVEIKSDIRKDKE